MTARNISQELIEWANLEPSEVAKIEPLQRKKRISFVLAAQENGSITQAQYVNFQSQRLEMPAADPANMFIPEKVLELVDRDLLLKYQAVPFFVDHKFLYIALADPEDILAQDDIRFMTGLELVVHVASPSSIVRALEGLSAEEEDGFGDLDDALAGVGEDDVDYDDGDEFDDDTATLEAAASAPVVKLVNHVIMDAIRKKASDIHIEPYEKSFRVRFRMDGMLREVMSPSPRLKSALISRLKIMAHLNIAERRLPQDGRIKVKTPSGKEVEFRVSILPTLFGEKVVMRLLDKSALKVDMTQLGLEDGSLAAIKDAIGKPYGMFLVTGPTGSGKTTTLYSAIMELNSEDVNISTAEDPVEFSVDGINQVLVKEDIGLSFASALRSFLRQDPDIILVGEIRDLETAEIAIKAALTGHLVLSTLHTNDAPSTLTRLLNMGVDNFLVASSVNSIVAQRLLRRLCAVCKRKAEKDEQALLSVGLSKEEIQTIDIYEPVGCSECNNTGYKGRLGVYEVLTVTPEMQELVLKGATVIEIKALALKQGMMTMRESALVKLRTGITSLREVLRVTV